MVDKSLHVLIVEDSEDDALLLVRILKKGGYHPVYERVETAAAMKKNLEEKQWNIILCDYKMPDFSAPSAISLLKESGIDIPVIVISGTIGEETAVECMRLGAQDYIMQDNVSRLCPAIARELKESKARDRHRQTEEALRQSERLFTNLINTIPDIIARTDLEGKLLFVNDYTMQMSGYRREEIMGHNLLEFIAPEDRERAKRGFELMLDRLGTPKEYLLLKKDGSRIPIDVNGDVLRNEDGTPFEIVNVCRDISERKQTEIILRENEEHLRGITQNIPGFIYRFYAKDSGEYGISYASGHLTDFFGETSGPIEMFSYFVSHVHEKDRKRFLKSIELAVKNRTAWNFIGRIYTQSGELIWFQGLSTPTRYKDQLVFDGIVLDITEQNLMNTELQQTLDSLRKAFGITIQVMVSAVEMKDPYTAGHQLRVADLARSIATEMGLPQHTIEGIRMSGSIHDIGKLSIPGEILSKPTKLTENEFALIKEHSQHGYEMLKDVESPWPLAEIVYQHHERMNGTGYPRRLKGDEIILEARIIAVADVVEAMASHRPYRPTLGIEAALEEIEKNKGILYDDVVANICLKLFREKGYQLTEDR